MITVDTILSDFHDLSKLEDLCRLCGKLQQTNVPIFDETHRYNYFKLINIHFKDELQVSKTDILPLKLCAKCLKAVMTWHEFYHDCLKVEKKFKKLVDKFSLNQDSEKRSSALVNDVEVIEVSVDGDNYDFFNESANDFDISNVNIKESTTFANANNFSHFDSLVNANDSVSSAENKTSDKPSDHSERITRKSEEPKKMNNTINQSLALGKRSMASKENGEYASFAAKRAKASDTTKTKTRDDNGGKVVVGFGSVLKRPTTSKLKKVGKPEISRTTTNSTINKVTESTKNIKLPNESVVLPVPLAKPKESTAAKPLTAPVITLDDDEDESELLGDEWKGEIKSDVEGEDDDDDDAIFNLEYELSDDSQSPNSNVAPNETASISGSETVAQRAKKVARPPKMCEVCGKVVSAKLFKEHMIMHSDPESMTCSCCGKLFSTVSTLKKHFIWTHTSLRPFMCDLCGNTFKRNDHLKLHREHFHANENTGGTAVKCGVCGVSVKTMVSLQSHMKRVHGEKKVGTYDKDLNHKILADKSYECGICSLNFKQFSYLRIHIKFVHEKGLPWHINQGASGPYKCEPCKSTYATLQSLREHNRRRHDGAPVEKFQKECSHCGMVYRNRLHYSKHLAKLSGRPTCYVCWNDFDSAEDLKVHINSEHLDELPFGCELCGVRFVYLTELRNHMYTHSKTKQFHCDQCPQSFVRKDFLKSHKRRHAGIRNHTCTECNKSFVEFCDLRKHMQVHFKNKIPISQVKTEITTN